MKNRLNNLIKWIIGGGILSLALGIPEIWIAKLITENNPENFETCVTIMLLSTMSVYFIITIVKIGQYEKWVKEHNCQKKLNSEFKTVVLNNSGYISEKSFECQAKVEDDGKIVCKIKLDMEKTFDSYEDFQKYFHLTEE